MLPIGAKYKKEVQHRDTEITEKAREEKRKSNSPKSRSGQENVRFSVISVSLWWIFSPRVDSSRLRR
jgi:hypothetical protein